MTKITKVTIGDQRITGTRTGYKLDDFKDRKTHVRTPVTEKSRMPSSA